MAPCTSSESSVADPDRELDDVVVAKAFARAGEALEERLTRKR